MKLFMIAQNNIRKAKAATLTLVLLVAMATIFLYTGANVLTHMGSFIDDKNRSLNGAHEIAITSRDAKEEVKSILAGMKGFSYVEQQDAMLYGTLKYQNIVTREKEYAMPTLVLPIHTDNRIGKITILDQTKQEYENGVVVPYVMKVANGYRTGDNLRLNVDGKSMELKIAGFYEDVMFANPTNLSLYKLYVNKQQFSKMENRLGGQKCTVSLSILKNIENSEKFENAFLAKTKTDMKDPSQIYLTSNYQTLKIGISVFILIIMSVLIAFSGIILVISMIVIRFSTRTHIENNMKNIGAMEAAGYTPNQLIAAILLEYGIIAFIGIVLGIVLSNLITPLITPIVSSSIGLRWFAGPSMKIMTISFVLVMISILIIAYLSGVKIKKITPLMALRNGIETHNFKKNRIPLHKTRLNVHISISMKELIYYKRQNIVSGIIIMLLSTVCVFALSMYYNFVIDNSAMMKLVGIENAQLEVKIPTDTEHIYRAIRNMPEVKKTVWLEGMDIRLRYKGKESSSHLLITENYNKLQIKTCVQGRMPEHDNEISMTKLIMDELGAKPGDTVEVEYNNQKKEYLIVGTTQHISYLGKGAELTTAGMTRLVSNYKMKTVMVYLKDGVDVSVFSTKLNHAYQKQGIQINNNKEMLDKTLESFQSAIRIIATGCIGVTVIIIVFIMLLIVRVRVMKERMHMGVSKALGYTSNQLIGHIMMSQLPVIVFSSVLGAVAGLYVTNPIMALSLAGNGILHCSFYVAKSYVVITSIGISIIGMITVFLVSLGIRTISPSAMFEQANS